MQGFFEACISGQCRKRVGEVLQKWHCWKIKHSVKGRIVMKSTPLGLRWLSVRPLSIYLQDVTNRRLIRCEPILVPQRLKVTKEL